MNAFFVWVPIFLWGVFGSIVLASLYIIGIF